MPTGTAGVRGRSSEAGTVDAYAVGSDGSLTPVQSGVAVGTAVEGIVAF